MRPIWTLTDEERDTIKVLYEKKIALENLSHIIDPENDKLREKLLLDYGKVMHEFQMWWDEKSTQYNWEKGQNWSVNFATKEIMLHE